MKISEIELTPFQRGETFGEGVALLDWMPNGQINLYVVKWDLGRKTFFFLKKKDLKMIDLSNFKLQENICVVYTQ